MTKKTSHDLLTALTSKQIPAHFTFEKLNLLELEAIYNFQWGDKNRALTHHHQILTSIELLFSKNQADEWNQAFETITSSS